MYIHVIGWITIANLKAIKIFMFHQIRQKSIYISQRMSQVKIYFQKRFDLLKKKRKLVLKGGGFMMFNVTFNNISVISWQILLKVFA